MVFETPCLNNHRTIILYYKDGDRRITVASAKKSGAGAGEYKMQLSPEEMESAGIVLPPLHFPVCRSTIVAV